MVKRLDRDSYMHREYGWIYGERPLKKWEIALGHFFKAVYAIIAIGLLVLAFKVCMAAYDIATTDRAHKTAPKELP